MSRKDAKPGKSLNYFIFKKTVGTAPVRIVEGDYRGFVTTMRADPDNAGTLYVGTEESANYPFVANDEQTTKIDLDKLFIRASVADQVIHFWGERDK